MRIYSDGPRRAEKLCLFAHYDPHGRIDPYVQHYLGALAALGFDCVLVSTAAALRAADLERAAPLCRAILQRENVGLDFGSWKAAADTVPGVWDYDAVLLANDSVFGPFRDLRPIVQRLDAAPELACGLNDSYELAHHLQSFFLYFKRPLFAHAAFRRYWEALRATDDKDFVIRNYEVGLSRTLAEHGIAWSALFRYEEVKRRAQAKGDAFQYRERLAAGPLNATLFMWDILLEEFGYPFIKTELLKIDRFASGAPARWRSLLPGAGGALAADVEGYVKRVKPHEPDDA
jgi:lipopolysaccharide biosynthesis protein